MTPRSFTAFLSTVEGSALARDIATDETRRAADPAQAIEETAKGLRTLYGNYQEALKESELPAWPPVLDSALRTHAARLVQAAASL